MLRENTTADTGRQPSVGCFGKGDMVRRWPGNSGHHWWSPHMVTTRVLHAGSNQTVDTDLDTGLEPTV